MIDEDCELDVISVGNKGTLRYRVNYTQLHWVIAVVIGTPNGFRHFYKV